MPDVSANTIFWEVDVQVDFMMPGGKLYVPGAEKIVANIARLVDCARQGEVFLVSSADAHQPADAELREWPPHCLKGTSGAALLPEAAAAPRLVIRNDRRFAIPEELGKFRQVTLEKNTLNAFDNPNTDVLLERMKQATAPKFVADPLFVVFGVATEYCVRCTVDELLKRKRRVAIVTDAVRAIDRAKGEQVLHDFQSRGARLISIDEALSLHGDSGESSKSAGRN